MGVNVYYDKKYHRWYIKNYVDGVNHTIICDENGEYFLSKKEANNFVRKHYSLLERQPKKVKNYSLAGLIKKFLAENKSKLKDSTFSNTCYTANKYFDKLLKNINFKELKNDDLILISERINKLKISIRSKKKLIVTIKKFIIFLNKQYFSSADIDYIRLSKNLYEDDHVFNYLSEDDFRKFIKVCDKPLFELMFTLFFYYGLRLGELRGLKIKDFDLKNKILYINRNASTKNINHITQLTSLKTASSKRYYPLSYKIIELYKKAVKFNDPECFLFTFSTSKNDAKNEINIIGDTTIKRYKDKYIKQSGVNYIRIHDFRHSCAIFLINHGFNIARISSWLGHSSPSVTAQYYLRFQDKSKEEILKIFDEID